MNVFPRIFMSIFTWCLIFCACQEEQSFQDFGQGETKPVTAAAVAEAKAQAEVFSVLEASYAVSVATAQGNSICSGSSRITLNSAFGLDILDPTITCLGFSFDLSLLLNSEVLNDALMTTLGSRDSLGETLSHDGDLLLTNRVINSSFQPPRPLLVGPVLIDHQKYQGFEKTYTSTLTHSDPITGVVTNASGQFQVRIIEPLVNYQAGNRNFSRVMHWEMTTSGFEGIPAIYGMTFKRIEWWWSGRPLMIPKIAVDLTVADLALISSGPINDLISGIIGDLTVTINLTSLKSVD